MAHPSRRRFLHQTSRLAAAGALPGALRLPAVHASGLDTIRLALVGCGGRGTGAAANALSVPEGGPLQLVAVADVFENRIRNACDYLAREFPQSTDLPEERRFLGFEAYRQAMDVLSPGDLVILATPPAFRWVHFQYAIERGLNVFMEKPVSVDAPSSRRMFELGRKAEEKGLKVGVGLMCRHCVARGELYKRIRDGAIGDLVLLRAYRNAGPTASAETFPNPGPLPDLLYQIQRFHAFLWLSGGAFSDFLIHNIDECCWMKDAWPVEAKGTGGRHYRNGAIDQNFDHYAVEYTFADGARLFLGGRTMPGCHQEFASYAHGATGSAIISAAAHAPSRCRLFRGQDMSNERVIWRAPRREPNPYQLEWNDLIRAIRNGEAYNEVHRGTMASLVTVMGRFAAHTGQRVTWEQILEHDEEFAPGVDQLSLDGPSPLMPAEDGSYPVPKPGLLKDREY